MAKSGGARYASTLTMEISVSALEASRQRAQEAVDELPEARHAAEMLRANLPAPPEISEATLKGKSKPAMFDTATDFVTATQRLIADKKLAGQTNPDDDEAEDND